MKTENKQWWDIKSDEIIKKIVLTKDELKITSANTTYVMITSDHQPAYNELMDLIKKLGKYVLIAKGRYCQNAIELENELKKTRITSIGFGKGRLQLAGKRIDYETLELLATFKGPMADINAYGDPVELNELLKKIAQIPHAEEKLNESKIAV